MCRYAAIEGESTMHRAWNEAVSTAGIAFYHAGTFAHGQRGLRLYADGLESAFHIFQDVSFPASRLVAFF